MGKCMDDGNMPKKFQQISMHGFQEIGQPFLVFLNICASIDQFVFMGRCIMMMATCSKRFISIHYIVWEIWTKFFGYKRLSSKPTRFIDNLQDPTGDPIGYIKTPTRLVVSSFKREK